MIKIMEQIIKIILLSIILIARIPVYAQDFGKPNVDTSQELKLRQENSRLKRQVSELRELLKKREDATERNLQLDSLVQVFKKEIIQFAENNETLDEKINDISIYYPIIIKELKVGNVYEDGSIETAFGDILYSSTSMLLTPQIEYIGLKPNQIITLYMKLYKDGIMDRNMNNSPLGYTQKCDITISESGKVALAGWGKAEKENLGKIINRLFQNRTRVEKAGKGNWPKGNYRYEIWYNDMCLKAINFVLN
ncbi:hypothetical protein FACS1894181_11080 [Bacteroidia bacterium]|nr:hypothetical protein FACS1894181_11080 [Bacteroidia bacterium]